MIIYLSLKKLILSTINLISAIRSNQLYVDQIYVPLSGFENVL